MPVSLGGAKRSLAIIWFVGFGIPFLILLLRTIRTDQRSQTDEMWNWFLPSVLPTLSLIIGVLVADLRKQPDLKKAADGSMFGFAFAMSLLYLAAVLITLVMSPLQPGAATDLLKRSHVYLGPTQGLTAGCLAAFFRR